MTKPEPWPVTFVDCLPATRVRAEGQLVHLCPFKDETDSGSIIVEWTTAGLTIELHSLAEFFAAFAGVKISHEALVDYIALTLSAQGKGRIQDIAVSFSVVTAGLFVITQADDALLRQPEH